MCQDNITEYMDFNTNHGLVAKGSDTKIIHAKVTEDLLKVDKKILDYLEYSDRAINYHSNIKKIFKRVSVGQKGYRG